MSSNTLVSADQLLTHLDDPLWVVLDCRFDLADGHAGQQAYAAGHIPGAHYADLDQDLARPPGPSEGRHPLPEPTEFAKRIMRWGITPDAAEFLKKISP